MDDGTCQKPLFDVEEVYGGFVKYQRWKENLTKLEK